MRKKFLSSAMALLLAGIMGTSSITAAAANVEEIPVQTKEKTEKADEETTLQENSQSEENSATQSSTDTENVAGKEGSTESGSSATSESSTESGSSSSTESSTESGSSSSTESVTESESSSSTESSTESESSTIQEDESEAELLKEIELELEFETEMPEEETASFVVPTDITDAPDASPLIITENVPGTVSGKRLTFTEVYNNSDATINFGEYTFYYQYPSGGGKVWNTGDFDIAPGQTIVLWQCDDSKYNAGQDVSFFNEYYGTNLVEGEDIFRINYTGIHSTAKRGFAFGRDERSIIAYAETNVDGTDITDVKAKQSVHYSYSGHGTTSYKAEVSQATPGSVENWQVPSALVHYETTPEIEVTQVSGPEQLGTDEAELVVTAKVSGNQGIAKGYLHYSQDTSTQDSVVEMTRAEGSDILKGSIPRSALWGNEITWYVEATYGGSYTTNSEKKTTVLGQQEESQDGAGPFVITEVVTPPLPTGEYAGNSQFSYVELYNRTTSAVNFSYYKFFYEYTGTTTADKTWTVTDPVTLVGPGETLVVWLTNNGNTVEDFNKFYGTNLELGKDIAIVNYAGFHESNCRTLKFGRTADNIFACATFNEGNKATIDRTGNQSIQYTYPRTSEGRSTIVSTNTKPTPGTVESWQVPAKLNSFGGYDGYPADNGGEPSLKLHGTCPESITEGEELNVTFDVADSMGIIGTKLYYRLDDETKWNVITETSRRVSYYYFAKIPADILFGHDSVEFYVELYNNYRGTKGEHYTVAIKRLNKVEDIRLSVNNDSILSGVKTITANDGTDNQQVKLSIDDKEVKAIPMLENGAYFGLLATDRDSYFKNVVTAPFGDDDREIIAYLVKWAADSDNKLIPVDSKYFRLDEDKNAYVITLSVWAGDSGTPFEDIYIPTENHEDYTVSHLKLRLANGREYLPVKIGPDDEATKAKTNLSTDYNASHKVGDSAGMSTRMDVTFEIPANEVTAVGYQLDTTTMADGSHTVKAVSGDKTVTATFIVDNTKPFIDLGIKEQEQISGTLSIDPVISDEYGIAKTSIMLDGEEITTPYSKLVREMKTGSHTLTVIAEDNAGNVEQKSVTFEINKVNPVIASIATDRIGENQASLRVELENVNAEDAKISYYKGKTLTVENGDIIAFSGEGDEPLTVGNKSTSMQVTAPTGDLPYFMYTIRTGKIEEEDSIFVNWDGTASYADDSHAIRMYVLNRAKNKWEVIGMPDEDGNIAASFQAKDTVVDGEAIVLVQCRAQLSNPTTKQKEAKAKAVSMQNSNWDGTGRPENYDFALAWITDTQYYCESYPEHYINQNRWIVEHAKEWKIPYVIHTGDIVDEYDMIGQWEVADQAMKIFEDAGMNYGVLAGNHDVAAGRLQYQNYWNYFGKDRFKDMPCYGGSYRNNAGHYDLISQNGQDLLLLYMSWDIYTDEIEWMNDVLAQYPDRKAIILLHRYTNVKETNGTYLDYAGKVLQEQVVKKNSNVIAVLNGHYHGSSFETAAFDDDGDGIKERTVYQICTDYQSAFEGGEEYIKFLYFDLANNKIYINSYSPMHDDFNYFDTPKYDSYEDGAKGTKIDIFELNVNFDTSEKTLTCNQFSAGIRSALKIGESDVDKLKSEMNWKGLQPDTRYTWYAAVENAKGGLVYSDLVTFKTTAKAAKPQNDDHSSENSNTENASDSGNSGNSQPSGSSTSTTTSQKAKQTQQTSEQQTQIIETPQTPLAQHLTGTTTDTNVNKTDSKSKTAKASGNTSSGQSQEEVQITGESVVTDQEEAVNQENLQETPAEVVQSQDSDKTQEQEVIGQEQNKQELSQTQDPDRAQITQENSYIIWIIVFVFLAGAAIAAGIVWKGKRSKEDR